MAENNDSTPTNNSLNLEEIKKQLKEEVKAELAKEKASESVVSLEEVQLIEDTKKIQSEIITQIKEDFKDSVDKVETSDIMFKVIKIMELIEKTKVKGADQKTLLIDILVEIYSDKNIPIGEEKRAFVLSFIQNDLPTTIDVIVDASKGKFDINKVEKVTTSCISLLFCCLKKNSN